MPSKYFINHPSWKENKDSDQVAGAKKFPIDKLYKGKLRQIGQVLMGLCPFHEEDTASFAIYPANNTWHCFAEGIGGDSISYYMKLTGSNFVTAIKELSK